MDRKPYKNPNRIGPDMVAIVAKHPEQCCIKYQGQYYAFTTCRVASCRRQFWRVYHGRSAPIRRNGKRAYGEYCSDECAYEGERILKNRRQARWQGRDRAMTALKAKPKRRKSSRAA